jgi:CRISPR system Cascade subunit CasE
MSELYLSRAVLRPAHERLGPLLFPGDPAQRVNASHRLVWTLFAPDAGPRPFLYRETAPAHASGRAARGAFHVLSRVAPGDGDGLFDVETKIFAPDLRAGDRLRFSLRANPAVHVNVAEDGAVKVRRQDVVMRALHSVPKAERAARRPALVRSAGLAWLERQAERGGFRLPEPEQIDIDGYEQFLLDPESRRKGRAAVHSRLDYEGILEIVDPALFMTRVAEGFGRAKAFGHGLMLIRRS